MSDILQGWKIKKLGEVCDVLNGGTPDTKKKEFWDGKILWIGVPLSVKCLPHRQHIVPTMWEGVPNPYN